MKVILFYKKLTKAGGAERLLLNQYKWLKKKNYCVKVVCFEFKNNLFLDEDLSVESSDIKILGGQWFVSMLKLFIYLFQNKAEIIVSSGVKEIFLASLITSNRYNLLLHHPLFMTLNETDKFSFFLKDKFNTMCKTNYGAHLFYDQMKSFNFIDYLKINFKACISVPSIKFAKNIFVLSDYGKYEKKILFNKDAIVCRGAIKENVLKEMKFEKKNIDEIVCVSRLEDDKRIDVLLKSFKKLLEIYPSKKLIICGTGSSKENFKDIAISLGISSNVIFKGFVSDIEIKSLYKSAYLFISLDWADFKITLFEALSYSQRILVSTETSAIDELESINHMVRVKPDIESAFNGMMQIYQTESKADYLLLRNFLDKYTWESYNKKLFKYVFEANN